MTLADRVLRAVTHPDVNYVEEVRGEIYVDSKTIGLDIVRLSTWESRIGLTKEKGPSKDIVGYMGANFTQNVWGYALNSGIQFQRVHRRKHDAIAYHGKDNVVKVRIVREEER